MPQSNRIQAGAEEHYPAFKAHLAVQGTALPAHVEQAFEAYL
jgi:hypothetical protein